MFSSNISPNSAPFPDIMLRKLSDLDFDVSRSLNVRCNSVIGLPIYGFLVASSSKIWPNSTPLRDIRF